MANQKDRIILGCMTIGPDASKGARITTVEGALEVLDYFKSRGYAELDTARMYVDGGSESRLAEVGWKSLGFLLATKVYPSPPGLHSSTNLKLKFAESQKALQSENVDIFYLHAADRSVPFVETLEAVNELYQKGYFKIFALSNYAAYEVAEIVTTCRARGWVVPTLYQAIYNPIARNIEKELIPALRRYGIDVVIYNPLAGGILTERYAPTDLLAKEIQEGRFSDPQLGKMYRDRYFKKSHLEAAAYLRKVAEEKGITLVQLVMRWLANHSALRTKLRGGNDGIIVGISSVDQLQENIDALEAPPLDEETAKKVEAAWTAEVEREGIDYWRGELVYGYETLDPRNW